MSGAFTQRHHYSMSSEVSDVTSPGSVQDLFSPTPEDEAVSSYYYTRYVCRFAFHASPDDLSFSRSLRENFGFEAAKYEAIKLWALRSRLSSAAQVVVAALFFYRTFVLTTFANVLMFLFGFYGAAAKKSEPMFAYLVLNALNAIKDIGLMYIYATTLLPGEWALVVIDLVVVTPISCYTGFYLYQSIQTTSLDSVRRSQSNIV